MEVKAYRSLIPEILIQVMLDEASKVFCSII